LTTKVGFERAHDVHRDIAIKKQLDAVGQRIVANLPPPVLDDRTRRGSG
jgi:hypothetical protein